MLGFVGTTDALVVTVLVIGGGCGMVGYSIGGGGTVMDAIWKKTGLAGGVGGVGAPSLVIQTLRFWSQASDVRVSSAILHEEGLKLSNSVFEPTDDMDDLDEQ